MITSYDYDDLEDNTKINRRFYKLGFKNKLRFNTLCGGDTKSLIQEQRKIGGCEEFKYLVTKIIGDGNH